MCVGRSWNGCRRPVVISERSYMGVKDPNGCKRPAVLSEKVLYGCERPTVLSEKFCCLRENTRSCSSLRLRVE